MSRFLASMGITFLRPHPPVIRAFEKAVSQQAIFQLEVPQDKTRSHHQYLSITACTDRSLTLASPEPFFMVAANWVRKSFLLRGLIQVDPGKPPLLHKFRARILAVGKDKRTITVSMPASVAVMEQRRNVRIALHPKHLPGLVIWGVRKDKDGGAGSILHHNILLDLGAGTPELRRTLMNVSAGGLRLSLAAKKAGPHMEWLEPGRRLIVQMVFSGPDFPGGSKHMFVAKICNTRTENARHELGVSFLAARVSDPKPRWKPLDKNGCELMARVIHFLQVQYYAQARQRLAREGSLANGTSGRRPSGRGA
jgi:hypothetical protein